MKAKSCFVCTGCGHKENQWMGRCVQCGEWNSFQEEQVRARSKSDEKENNSDGPKKISDVSKATYQRVPTGVNEFDRVVGGGLVRGSLLLVGGEPGIGKSTLLMEICGRLAQLDSSETILYVSGEESEGQVADRSGRLGVNSDKILVFNETGWERIKETLKKVKPQYLVLDSIQTTTSENIQGVPGSVSQVREVTYEILNYCKAHEITSLIIGHVTKEGSIAGPKILEHMVDAVIYFEGDRLGEYRILRAMKNRFGNTNEVGIFEMKESGLVEVANPSKYFVDQWSEDSFGRSLSCIVEGSRTLFIETQALVVENKNGFGRRTSQGIDSNRLAMLVAVVEKYFDIPLGFSDIYANVVGGVRVKAHDADLSIIASILSSLRKRPVPEGTVLLGEVGLTGEIRSVPMIELRMKEIEQLNYKRLITSQRIAKSYAARTKFELVGIERADQLDQLLFGQEGKAS